VLSGGIRLSARWISFDVTADSKGRRYRNVQPGGADVPEYQKRANQLFGKLNCPDGRQLDFYIPLR